MPSADMQKILATIRTIRQAAKLKGEKALTMSSMPTLTQSEKVTEGAHLQFSICGFLLMWPKSTLIAKEAFLYLFVIVGQLNTRNCECQASLPTIGEALIRRRYINVMTL